MLTRNFYENRFAEVEIRRFENRNLGFHAVPVARIGICTIMQANTNAITMLWARTTKYLLEKSENDFQIDVNPFLQICFHKKFV